MTETVKKSCTSGPSNMATRQCPTTQERFRPRIFLLSEHRAAALVTLLSRLESMRSMGAHTLCMRAHQEAIAGN